MASEFTTIEPYTAPTTGASFSGLDPVLSSMGVLVGLLKDEGNGSYALIAEWFTNPFVKTQEGIRQNPEQFDSLFTELLGKIGGNALGVPVQNPALLGNWYPIKYSKDGKDVNTGVHIVTNQTKVEDKDYTVIGVGVLHGWEYSFTGTGEDAGKDKVLEASVWGMVPFVYLGQGNFNITFTTPGFPIVFGAAVNGKDAANPLIGINGIEFNGVKVNANIDFAALAHNKTPFELGVEIIGLKLAGDAKPTNRSLADLTTITAEQIMESAASLFVGGLSTVFPSMADNIKYFSPLFGLSATVPGMPEIQMPILKWYDLFNAISHGGVSQLFLDWFNQIASNNDLLRGWISSLSGFLLNKPDVAGNGTRTNPFLVPVFEPGSIGSMSISIATEVVGKGIRILYPGISFLGDPIEFGTSGIEFTMQAEAELARFQLTGDDIGLSPMINFTAKFTLQNKTEGTPFAQFNVGGQDYEIGTLEGGMSLGLSANMMPWFYLTSVTIGATKYDTLNLLSPTQLANAGATVLSTGLKSLLTFGTGNETLSNSLQGIIGVEKPAGVTDWPTSLIPPFSPEGILTSVTDPIGAWAKYYNDVLVYATEVDGKLAFAYIVESFATLLQAATDNTPIIIEGSGSKVDPWMAGISIKDADLPAYLTCYQLPGNDTVDLFIGLELAPVLTLAGVNIIPSFVLDAVTIKFPKTGGFSDTTADWFSNVGVLLTLPDGFTTPEIGGMQVKVGKSQLSASWSQVDGWGWSMFVEAPTLIVDGIETALGTDLNFDKKSTLEDLVKQSATTFGPFLVSALGTLMMRSKTRPGLFVAGAMGLVKDITKSPAFPKSGLDWSGFELYPFSENGFTDPWTDFNNQIDAIFNTEAKGKSVLGLLAYALTSNPTAPTINGTGTFSSPWITPLPLGFSAPVWYDTSAKNLGVGLGREDTYTYGSTFQFDLLSRLNLLEYSTIQQKINFTDNLPSLSLTGTLSKPGGGNLIDLGPNIGSLEKAIVGFNLTIVDGKVQFEPLVTLVNVTLAGQVLKPEITLADFQDPNFDATLQTAFLSVLNGAIQLAIEEVKDVSGFKTTYELLNLLGLTINRKDDTSPYGINAAGWMGLLSNPDTYIKGQLLSLITDQVNRKKLFDFLLEITGVTLPDFSSAPVALEFLYALDICGPKDQGYPLLPSAIIEILSNPVEGFKSRFTNLFADAPTVQVLAAQLTKNIPATKVGNFTFSGTSNGAIQFEVLAADAYDVGGFVKLYGGIVLNLSDQSLVFTGNIYLPEVGFTLVSRLALHLQNGVLQPPVFTSQLVWGDGNVPAALPLDLFPFQGETFLNQIADLAPAYTLNILLNALFEDQLLGEYELIQKIFTGLGIGKDENGIWRMPSLMGILRDPLGWMLSEEVLGNENGQFDISKLIQLLGNLPQSTYKGITLNPTVGSGVKITGLPFGFYADMNGTSGVNPVSNFVFGIDQLEIVKNIALLENVNFGVSLDQNYQPAFSGGLDIVTPQPEPQGFFLHVGYDKSFLLRLSQGSPKKPVGNGVQFLPFQGWGTIAGDAAAMAAAEVINTLMPKLMDYLTTTYPISTTAGKFFKAMKDFGTAMDIEDLVTNKLLPLLTPENFKDSDKLLKDLETAAFSWVKDRYSSENKSDTAKGIVDLLKLVLPPTSLGTEDGLITYTPDDSLPFTLYAGVNDSNAVGLWAGLELPSAKLLKMKFERTGVGYNLTNDVLDINFGLNLVVPIESINGPGLSILFNSSKNPAFNFSFDPLADPQNMSTPSVLQRELLPSFFGGGDVGPEVSAWLLDVIKDVLPRYISLLLLNESSVKGWLEAGISSTVPITPIALLEATSLVKNTPSGGAKIYYLNSFDELAKLTPGGFLGNFLFTLLQAPLTILDVAGVKIIIGPKTTNGVPIPDFYGMRLVAPELKINAVPNLIFRLGATDTTWIDESWGNGSKPPFGDPGIGTYVKVTKSSLVGQPVQYEVDFTWFNLVLSNVGFDVIGKNGRPIVDTARFKLGTVDPRVAFNLQFQGQGAVAIDFGAGLTIDDMGISLAPTSISEGGGNNPIAKNVLGSGDSKGQESPTDPKFSVDIGYIYQKDLYLNLRSNTGSGHDVIIPVQRAFGPLFIASLGLGWEEKPDYKLDFIFSGSFELAGMNAAMQGLRIGVPVTKPLDWSEYSIDLDGFAISYSGGIKIEAGFLKDDSQEYVQYTGLAIISASKFSIGAIGSYAQIDNPKGGKETSLFIFGVLNAPLGGVPAFFVEGIAAGFGYNRSLIIPSIENVADFPLVKGVAEGSFTQGEDPMAALLKLNDSLTPAIGEYWFAAGLKFSSFQLLETTALLFISFGKEFEFNLLGVCVASLPPKVGPSSALAYFELAIKLSIKPEAGYVSLEAQLTPNSFVLARDVKITGGFAFYLWFKNIPQKDGSTIPAGDFVVTLGGYHPAFKKPSYYPEVPRLGLQWKMDFSVGKVSITGGAYFAICPTAVMAGGFLKIAFNAGPLIAGLDAYANFLIEWKPFYFNVGIGVSVYAGFETTIAGVSVRLVAKLGCTLELAGPPVYGKVEVDWYVISFSIPIGTNPDNEDKNNLNWKGFEEAFLPPEAPVKLGETVDSLQQKVNSDAALTMEEPPMTVQQVVKWSAKTGLGGENEGTWTLNPIPWELNVDSAIPVSELTVDESAFSQQGSSLIGVRPMGFVDSLEAPMVVSLTSGGKSIDLTKHKIKMLGTNNGAVSALWSKSVLDRSIAPQAKNLVIDGALFGLNLQANEYLYYGVVPAFPIANLNYVEGDTKRLPLDPALIAKYPAAELYPNAQHPDWKQGMAYTVIMNTIMDGTTITKRNDVFSVLRANGLNAPDAPDLSVMASSASLILQALPVLAKVGIYQNSGEVEPAPPTSTLQVRKANLKADPIPIIAAPAFQGELRSYRLSGEAISSDFAPNVQRVQGTWKIAERYSGGLRRDVNVSEKKDAIPPKKLYDGSIVLYEIDPKSEIELNLDINLPIVISIFDEFGALMDSRIFEQSTEYTLPTGSGQVAMEGISDMDDSILGFQIGSKLSKINAAWASYNGCLIRTQNITRVSPENTNTPIGILLAETMLEQNLVLGANGVKSPGWIQTIFHDTVNIIIIRVKGDVKEDALAVTVAANELPKVVGKTKAQSVNQTNGYTLLSYASPVLVADNTSIGMIVKPKDSSIEIQGIYGIPQEIESLSTNFQRQTLRAGGIHLKGGSVLTSTISIIQK